MHHKKDLSMKHRLDYRTAVVLLFVGWLGASAGPAWAQFGGFGGFGGGGGTRRTTGNYPGSTEVGSATFTTDPETRKLMVVTDEETAQYISQVVSNLDRPAPQVLINVVFLEATYRKGLDVGVQGTYRKTTDGGNTVNLGQNFNGMSGLAGPFNQGIFSMAGDSWEVTLRAIAENGKLEVLSRPSVLARNNQQAVITVGQQVPLITGVSYVANFGQVNSINYQSVGIILRVTPFITSDNMVEMIVSPEISNLSDQTVAIAAGTNNSTVGAPVINTRSADTVVVTPDGQTVVIGGLMQDSKTEAISKVPVLGDIPLLGLAFRRKVKGDSKTELLIFLTPHIVKHPSQLAAMASTARTNTAIVPKAFSEEQLNRFLDSMPPQEGAAPKAKKR
jgi:general secretion pathway protein D